MAKLTQTFLVDDFRGIRFEVYHPADFYPWRGYILLDLDQFEDRNLAEALWLTPEDLCFGDRKYYRYSEIDFISSLPFHGGCTFYEKRLYASGKDGEGRVIKIGCDYGHCDDRAQDYTEGTVAADMRRAIHAVHKTTTYLLRCGGDGRLVKESEGYYSESRGRFYSNGYIREKEATK